MIEWYQHLPYSLEPIVFTIGFFSLHWYSLFYMTAILMNSVLLRYITRSKFSLDRYFDLLFYILVGMLIGARLGYVVLYHFDFYLAHPWSIIAPFDIHTGLWTGISGMSYYGGLIGGLIGIALFARHYQYQFLEIADDVAFVAPFGYFFGRIGNFFNGELYGRVTDAAWGMFFPSAPDAGTVLRHPSQWYEAFLEGIVLFLVLALVRSKSLFPGAIALLYGIGYGIIRFCLEFVREPDPQFGLIFLGWSFNQYVALSVSVISCGLFYWLRRKSMVY